MAQQEAEKHNIQRRCPMQCWVKQTLRFHVELDSTKQPMLPKTLMGLHRESAGGFLEGGL